MKFRVTMKDPDCLHDAIEDAVKTEVGNIAGLSWGDYYYGGVWGQKRADPGVARSHARRMTPNARLSGGRRPSA